MVVKVMATELPSNALFFIHRWPLCDQVFSKMRLKYHHAAGDTAICPTLLVQTFKAYIGIPVVPRPANLCATTNAQKRPGTGNDSGNIRLRRLFIVTLLIIILGFRSIDRQHGDATTRTIGFPEEPPPQTIVMKDVVASLCRRKGNFVTNLECFHADAAFLFLVITVSNMLLARCGQYFILALGDFYLLQNLLPCEEERPTLGDDILLTGGVVVR